MSHPLPRILAVLLVAACSVVAACDEENEGGGDGDSGGANSCDIYEFEYEGEPEDGSCPPVECCPDDALGTFSAIDNGRCLSSANCEAVCEDTDEAFDCL